MGMHTDVKEEKVENDDGGTGAGMGGLGGGMEGSDKILLFVKDQENAKKFEMDPKLLDLSAMIKSTLDEMKDMNDDMDDDDVDLAVPLDPEYVDD